MDSEKTETRKKSKSAKLPKVEGRFWMLLHLKREIYLSGNNNIFLALKIRKLRKLRTLRAEIF